MLFTKEEYKQRLSKVQKMMQEKGIELLISHDTNNINYLTGYDAWSFYYAQCAVVHINADEPICFVRDQDAGVFSKVASAANIDSSGPYTGESYDAAALIVLAMQAGNSADRASIAKNVMDVANSPGTKIYPGELKKGLDLLAKGKKVDYEGATGVTFTSVGEAEGSFLEQEVKGGKFKTKKQR